MSATAKISTQESPLEDNRRTTLTVFHSSLFRIEFHRHAIALLADQRDNRPGVAFWVEGRGGAVAQSFCTCAVSQQKTCTHLKELAQAAEPLRCPVNKADFDAGFRSSVWCQMASALTDHERAPLDSVKLQPVECADKRHISVVDRAGQELFFYFSQGNDLSRFMERCLTPADNEQHVPGRADVLRQLTLLTLSPNERVLMGLGQTSRGQVMEKSFWFRAAYHCYREWGSQEVSFHPAVDERSGAFFIGCQAANSTEVCRIVVPRSAVKKILSGLSESLPNQHGMAITPIPLRSIFKIEMNTELDLEIRPQIKLVQESGEERFYNSEELERFRYGNLIYLKELGILAELERPDSKRKFHAPTKMVLKKSQIPAFLEESGEELRQGCFVVADDVKGLRIFKDYESLQITPEALDKDWCWLSVTYGFGNSCISLAQLLEAKKEGRRYIGTPEGWIDCVAGFLEPTSQFLEQLAASGAEKEANANRFKLSKHDLFRLQAACSGSTEFKMLGNPDRVALLKKLLDTKPATLAPEVRGLTSTLREYQKRGLEWLLFLFENGFGGLLCDDMGLGKTHQVMACLTYLRENSLVDAPFLIVCPTSVLSHWETKFRQHAPCLRVSLYYGGDRVLAEAIENADAVVTSYGLLRRDIELLDKHLFSIAVFDEIQHLKSSETQLHKAARRIGSTIRLGLTGTPIENTLMDLKSLMDFTVPGYLGTDENFQARYMGPITANVKSPKREELQRLISPFVLRRLKSTVLGELPPKIEDIRVCHLSEDQVRLYRDAIARRAHNYVDALTDSEKSVPYFHIFALLGLLKQICNHPALVERTPEDYEEYESGKWDVFKDILNESLDAGRKVVIYSQYVGMIDIIVRYLDPLGVGFVKLVGASRNRGELISKFNDDPNCRIFVGSLGAGGTGFDLVAASVVIHYDRWWNAAKEDQATDRVHRIGQNRGVQVFKLVTMGTLEEKISAIISKKRQLMDHIIQEDDPGLLKSFSREQLLGMLSMPS